MKKSRKEQKKDEVVEDIHDERIRTYMEQEAQNLLRELISNGDKAQIVPIYDPYLGFVYKKVEQAFEKEPSPEQVMDFLDRLARLEILEKSFFDTVSACPHCDSNNLTLHYHCPKCKNHNVIKTNLTEHIPCGYIAERIKFVDEKCPRCGEVLKKDNYRDMGRWYLCRSCNEKTVKPGLLIHCRKCNSKFSLEESKLLEIPKFSLNQTRKNEIKRRVASFDKICKMLKDLGFEVEIPGFLMGQKSGIQHHFTVVARKMVEEEEFVVALDHAVSEKEIKSSEVIVFVYKISEVKADIPIFVAINKLSQEAKKTAQGRQILLLEGSPESKVIINKIWRKIDLEIANRNSKKLEVSLVPEIKDNQGETEVTYSSEIRPQLFSPVTSVHNTEKANVKRKLKGYFNNLAKNLKKPEDRES